MNRLDLPLRANGLFSLASGALLAITPATIGDWLEVDAALLLRLFGLTLLGHAAVLFWAATRPDPRPLAKLNLLSVAPYPFAMVGLVIAGVIETTLGQALVLSDGLIIAALAIWHGAALRRNDESITLASA